jgi:hypothetical protein
MIKYKIYNKTENEYYELLIDEIFENIKKNPDDEFYKINKNNEKKIINKEIILKTQFICHRINTIEELKTIPKFFGIELDIRDKNNKKELILQHDPYLSGEDFEEYLKFYNHKTLILNIKSERIEPLCIELMKKYHVKDYFFLDSNIPMIYLLNKEYHENNIACRLSEFEPIELFEKIKKMVNWIIVDCYSKIDSLTPENYNTIKKENKKICLISPELQKQEEKIEKYREYIINNNIIPDSICCKIYNIINWI